MIYIFIYLLIYDVKFGRDALRFEYERTEEYTLTHQQEHAYPYSSAKSITGST